MVALPARLQGAATAAAALLGGGGLQHLLWAPGTPKQPSVTVRVSVPTVLPGCVAAVFPEREPDVRFCPIDCCEPVVAEAEVCGWPNAGWCHWLTALSCVFSGWSATRQCCRSPEPRFRASVVRGRRPGRGRAVRGQPGVTALVTFEGDPGWHHERLFLWPVTPTSWIVMTADGDVY